MIFQHDFRGDFEVIRRAWDAGERFALGRFADGELAILRRRQIKTRDGWDATEAPDALVSLLKEAVSYRAPGYHVGISCPCCDPQGAAWYRAALGEDLRHATFSNIFVNGNHRDWLRFVLPRDFAVVGPMFANYRVPLNAVNGEESLDQWLPSLLGRLAGENKPILVAAGPLGGVIAMLYWSAMPPQSRQTIIDIGSSLDLFIHGRAPDCGYWRGAQTASKVCTWATQEERK